MPNAESTISEMFIRAEKCDGRTKVDLPQNHELENRGAVVDFNSMIDILAEP